MYAIEHLSWIYQEDSEKYFSIKLTKSITTLMKSHDFDYFDENIFISLLSMKFKDSNQIFKYQIPILKSDHQSLYFKAKIISKIKFPDFILSFHFDLST